MSRDNFTTPERGSTMYNGATIDTNNLSYLDYEGQTKIFEDKIWNGSGVKADRLNGREVVCRLVRNMSGATLYPKRLVQLDPANPGRVTGYTNSLCQEAYVVDEFLPATGVPNGDLFWIVISGPTQVLTPMTGAEFNTTLIAAGQVLVAGTTSTGTTAAGTTGAPGRIAGFTILAATTVPQFTNILDYATNWVCRAISAATSGNTNTGILVDVRRPAGYP